MATWQLSVRCVAEPLCHPRIVGRSSRFQSKTLQGCISKAMLCHPGQNKLPANVMDVLILITSYSAMLSSSNELELASSLRGFAKWHSPFWFIHLKTNCFVRELRGEPDTGNSSSLYTDHSGNVAGQFFSKSANAFLALWRSSR